MTQETPEALKKTDEAYKTAGRALEKQFRGVEKAQSAELVAAQERVRAYDRFFLGRIVVEHVADPAKIRYFAGIAESEDPGEDMRHLALDEGHTASLEGILAGNVRFFLEESGQRGVEELQDHEPQPPLVISFEIPGIHTNEEEGESLTRASWLGDITHYSGEFAAIEWRLPTFEEIQQFAGIPEASTV